ncbi:hypothetical protein ACIRS1_22335 [Kitasatospora sp. NPDC101176]|uniref:hypothetical protein n=1 Tax=Kitasatospora sp. NPDC101176 TaxID=3364099 RepID=UPI003821006C
MNTRVWTAGHTTGGPLDDVFRLVRARVADVVIERRVKQDEADDDDLFLIRMVTNPEPLELECRPGGRPPFIVSDEYSWIDARDSAEAAEAVYELLSA